jgi:hypothetical protein
MKNHTRVPRAPQDTRDRVGLLVGAIDFNFAWQFGEPPLFIEQHRVYCFVVDWIADGAAEDCLFANLALAADDVLIGR